MIRRLFYMVSISVFCFVRMGMLLCHFAFLACDTGPGATSGVLTGRVECCVPIGSSVPVDRGQGESCTAACCCTRRIAEEHQQDTEAVGDGAGCGSGGRQCDGRGMRGG